MRAVLVDVPAELLEQRRRKGHDLFDEVWEGVLHMVPQPSSDHQRLGTELLVALSPAARSNDLVAAYELALFRPDVGERDYRVPDLVFARVEHVSARGVEGRASLVVEILSPNDETYDKLDFYGEVGVEELLVVDPQSRLVELFARRGSRLHAALPHADGSLTVASLGVSFSTVNGPRLRVEWAEYAVEI